MTALTNLELACGLVLGLDRPARWSAQVSSVRRAPQEALDAAILPALRRPPCLVSFSGGRDSAVVLAAATALARRHGLAEPIPATNRFEGAPAADESRWQELLISGLGLTDWDRRVYTDELDALGPYAQRVLRRHGLGWPFNLHFHLPIIDAARGGSLLTGIGGDELFGATRRTRLTAVLSRQARPGRRDAARAALAFGPAGVRERVLARRLPVDFTWLRPAAARAATRALAATSAREPRAMDARLRWWRALRYFEVGMQDLEPLAADGDVQIVHPLADEALWEAAGRVAPRSGYADRTHGMRSLFGDLLPQEVLARPDKASFDEPFFNRHARAFAHAWTGGGVPDDLVDGEALRRHWLGASPRPQSFSLLQAAWLADSERRPSAGDRVQEPLGGLR